MAAPLATSVSWPDRRIIVTGGGGFLGSHVVEALRARGVPDEHLCIPRSRDVDLTDQAQVARLYDTAFGEKKADMVIHVAAKVGGIGANRAEPGQFFYANMAMAMHLIEQARLDGLIDRDGRFVHVGTICSYPKHTPVPFREEEMWNGYPDETSAPYGVAKMAGWQMLDAYRRQYGMQSAYVLPVNLYGPRDNFDPDSSHVVAALIRKCVEAADRGDASIEVWGTGIASREFLYVGDAADGIITAAERMTEPAPINLGTNVEVTIKELVNTIARLSGFCADEGELASKIVWDSTKPDGQPRRCVDTSRASDLLGWQAQVSLEQGLTKAIEWYRADRA